MASEQSNSSGRTLRIFFVCRLSYGTALIRAASIEATVLMDCDLSENGEYLKDCTAGYLWKMADRTVAME